MTTDDFRTEARALLSRLLEEAATNDQREMMLEVYAEEFTKLHREYAHGLLNDVISDVRTRLDARLSPEYGRAASGAFLRPPRVSAFA